VRISRVFFFFFCVHTLLGNLVEGEILQMKAFSFSFSASFLEGSPFFPHGAFDGEKVNGFFFLARYGKSAMRMFSFPLFFLSPPILPMTSSRYIRLRIGARPGGAWASGTFFFFLTTSVTPCIVAGSADRLPYFL